MTSARTAVQELAQQERSRREMIALAVVGGAGAAFFGGATRADAAPEAGPLAAGNPGRFRLTVLGTTDTHGNALNWDYFKDVEYDDSAHNDSGRAKISTLVTAMRKERGSHNALLLHAGNTMRGNRYAMDIAIKRNFTFTASFD